MPEEEQSISWQVLTHVHKERTNDWYWALGLIAVVAAGLVIWLGNLLFGILILLCAGSIGALAMRGPREHSVDIGERGISIDGTLYTYRTLKSFWVDANPEYPRLFLTTGGIITPHMAIPLEDEYHAQVVHAYLVDRLDEVEQEPHLGEHVAHILGL
ncbi:MAG TPA: hypothetical protein VN665_02785 [Candidatus Paceibacterota bacterium]|nr:hypothetical protein [Candidatus Paceibacterota bacterium]